MFYVRAATFFLGGGGQSDSKLVKGGSQAEHVKITKTDIPNLLNYCVFLQYPYNLRM